MDGANALLKSEILILLSTLKNELEENGCVGDNSEVFEKFKDDNLKEDAFKSLRNPYQQKTFFGKIVVCGTVRFATLHRSIALIESFRTACLLTSGRFLIQRNPGY